MNPDLQLIKEIRKETYINIEIYIINEKFNLHDEIYVILENFYTINENNANRNNSFNKFLIKSSINKKFIAENFCLVGHKGEVIILYLDGIVLHHMPEQICKLKNLLALFLHDNQLSSLSGIGELESLELLYLGGKQNIYQLPKEISHLSNLKGLFVQMNSRLTVPPQDIVDQGVDAVKNYFESLRESSGVSYLYEAKMVVIGRGFTGKTSLVRKLTIPNYRLELDIKSTAGIDIELWDVELPLEKSDSFRFNIWDFAGQEKYDATHQFFITERTLYIFVTEARQESNYLDFDYWLNIVQLLGDHSPVIVVQNKIDVRQRLLPTDRYRARFSNILAFVDVSCADGYEETIDELIKEIKLGIRKLPLVVDQLPIEWVDIRKKLESLKRDYISYDEYLAICASHGLNQEKADYLSRYFHDLGVIVHYHKDLLLKKLVVVNPDWAVDGAYNVLDTRRIERDNGRFTDADLQSIWSEARYQDKHPELLALMKNYELCFELGDSGTYIAPELLSPNPVPFNAIKGPERLTFIYQYEFMPAGILTRLIVKIHQLIEKENFWRHGVIVTFEKARASIIEDDRKKTIRIEIEGEKDKKELLAIIRQKFSELHSDFNNIRYEEFIPCHCSACQREEKATHFFKWKTVLNYDHNKIKQIRCEESLIEVDVKALIGDIPRSLHDVHLVESSISHLSTSAQKAPPQHVEQSPRQDKWWQTALLGGGAVVLVASLLLFLPEEWLKIRIVILAGAIVTGILFLRDPKRRFMRAFWGIYSGWSLLNIFPNLQLSFDNIFEGSESNAYSILDVNLDGPSFWVNVPLIMLMSVLAVLDFLSEKQDK